jgi:hypothetical protein
MDAFQWKFSTRWVLPVALIVFLLPVISTEYNVLSFTHGVFSYPFDDTFIHLAIAKNIAFHGIWGISPYEFSSASSSVLYPLLLAGCMKLFGPLTALPLIINVLAGIMLIVVVQKWLSKQGLSGLAQLLGLLTLIILIPLPALVVFGMEHTLQILFDFLFIYTFAAALEDKRPLPWSVYLYGVLVMAIRYEGMFIIAGACLLLIFKPHYSLARRLISAAKLGLLSFLPILIFGLYAMSKGSYFFPNSVLVKSVAPPLTPEGIIRWLTYDIYTRLYYAHPTIGGLAIQRLLIIIPLVWLASSKTLGNIPVGRTILLLLIPTILFHLWFANTSILFRYEAYLIGCSIPVICALAAKYLPNFLPEKWVLTQWVALFVVFLLFIPVLLRAQAAFELTTQGSINIYEQQYQMGQFVKKYYPNTPIAMGDIGAISFYSAGHNLDLEGLGNLDVARSRKNHYWTPDFLYSISKRDSVRFAIVFDRSYPWQLLTRWQKIATWQIPNNVACYSDLVSFYAVDSTYSPGLKENLKDFQPLLPGDVIAQYFELK